MAQAPAGNDGGVNGRNHLRLGFNQRGLFYAGLTSALLACSAGGVEGESTTSPSAGPPAVAAGGSSGATAPLGGTSGIVLTVAGTTADTGGSGGAADLGGLHPMQSRPVQLDAVAAQLGITQGTIYTLDLFHAERHTTASTFRIDTNLSFVDCGTVIPNVVK